MDEKKTDCAESPEVSELPEENGTAEGSENANDTETIPAVEENSLDSLLYDAEETLDTHETPEEAAHYESALADYKEIIAKAFSKNAEADDTEDSGTSQENEVQEVAMEAAVDSLDDTPIEDKIENTEELPDIIDIAFSDVNAFADIDEIDAPESDPLPDDTKSECCEESEIKEDAVDVVQLEMDLGISETEDIETPSEDHRTPIEKEDHKYDPQNPRKIDSVFEFVELFIFTLVSVMVATAFFFRHSIVDGESMKKTLSDGDHLIISDFFYEPDYGDIIVFEDYSTGLRVPLVKRVIGLEGDTVEVRYDDGNYAVYRNGILIEEDYVYTGGDGIVNISDSWTVGEDEVFVLGDHRNDSRDSRMFGVINEDTILGKVMFRFYPFSEFGTVE